MRYPAPSPLQLTSRDLALLSLVYEYGGVTVRHLRRRFFPTPGATSPCYRRIGLLVEHRYLTAVRLPASSGQGSGPAFLTIGPAGRKIVATALGLSGRELGYMERTFAPLFVRHHSAICDTRLSFELATEPSAGTQLVEWISERELKHAPIRLTDPKTNTSLPIVPDAALSLQLPDGRSQLLYLEQDMATIAPRRMRTKVRLYLAHQAGEPRLPIVLMVTTSRRRQNAIAQWVAEEAVWLQREKGIPGDATRFFLTIAEQLSEHTVLTEPIWQVVSGPAAFSLLPPASQADGHQLPTPVHATAARSEL